MLRRRLRLSLLLPLVVGLPSFAGDDPRFAPGFIAALREKGMYDVAVEYINQIRDDPDFPAAAKSTLDYEEGRTLIDMATHSNDPEQSKEKLEKAKQKIERFVKAFPDSPLTTEALVDLADLLYERGRSEVDLAGEARAGNERESKLAEARGDYAKARDAFQQAFEKLSARFNAFPKFIPNDDPRKAERDRVQVALMQAELHQAVNDYYDAQSHAPASKERGEMLEKSLKQFDDIYKRYRTQMAGFTARMWQAKCFEEKGELGPAMGIYNELIDHPDPRLRGLQRQVRYFRIIVMAKRKEFALAADECVRWLEAFPRDRRSYEALGVQFELAKNILAQVPNLDEANQAKAIRTATEHLADVVRVVSPFKPDAVELLQKYRPKSAALAIDLAKLSFDEAMATAEQSISMLEYEKAIAALKVAIRKADPARDPAKANRARFTLAFCCYQAKRYYDAVVLAEHIARRYPRDELAAKSTEVAIAALVDAYNTWTVGNRAGDLDHLVELAKYTAETWPEIEPGDSARVALGQIALGRGQYAEAIAAFDAVRTASSKWIDAQAACGDAHWKLSRTLRDKGDEKASEAEVKLAIDKLTGAIKARRDASVPDTDLNLIGNACDLAVIRLETDKPLEALALLDPIAKKVAAAPKAPELAKVQARMLSNILRAHVATGKTDLAIGDMKAIEALGGAGASTAQLYFELGKLLEREIETLEKRNDRMALDRTRTSYRKFLEALVANKSGQSFASLQWAGENLLKLGSTKQANEVFARILEVYSKDADFLKTPRANDRLLNIRVKQVAALRGEKNFAEAENKLGEIINENKRLLEPQMERGYLIDARAEAKDTTWGNSYIYWRTLALKMTNLSPKPVEYYEAWLHAASALHKQGKDDQARQTLASVMKLSPSLGGPEMKAKYTDLAKQVGR
jgi:tetratricopeptide (TPR) repeat protein